MPSLPQDNDPLRVAYWQSEAKQAQDIRTVTSLGKYIKRHWPNLPDHIIRDWVAKAEPATFAFWDTRQDIVRSVQEGPKSCMQWPGHDEDDAHPYEAYDPALQWKAAVRLQGGEILGRTLVCFQHNPPVWVRSYTKEDGRSGTDFALEDWLKEQGCVKRSQGWPEGTKLAFIEDAVPYLDASTDCNRKIDIYKDTIVVSQDGQYIADCQDGSYSEDDRSMCDECGGNFYEEDITYVESEERSVCSCCLSKHYTYVEGTMYGSHTSSYYVRDENVVRVNGDVYDGNNLPDYIVELADGDYAHTDDVVCTEDGKCYHVDEVDSRSPARRNDNCKLVQTDDGPALLVEDAAWCEYNEEWFRKESCIKLDNGDFVYKDNLDDYLVDIDEPVLRSLVSDEKVAEVMARENWVGRTSEEVAQVIIEDRKIGIY
jgi:hypothetical protein